MLVRTHANDERQRGDGSHGEEQWPRSLDGGQKVREKCANPIKSVSGFALPTRVFFGQTFRTETFLFAPRFFINVNGFAKMDYEKGEVVFTIGTKVESLGIPEGSTRA